MKMTKSKFAYMINHWYTKSSTDIANHLKVTTVTLHQWAAAYRKLGGDLPRKGAIKDNTLQTAIIEDYIKNNPNKRKK